ncbi:MAG: hypothetical protein M3Z05_22445 [Gemmatimonadota bacterium]|nr:hypothetical protein [Gemmatimonadota bacterium]
MIRTQSLRSFVTGLGVVVLVAACTPEKISAPLAPLTTPAASAAAPSSVSPAASPDLLGGLVQTVTTTLSNLLFPVVQRETALASSITVTKVIPATGGSITIPSAGMSITFAAGALQRATAITVTADAGKAVSYEFAPHGIQFGAPVTIQQDMTVTTLVNNVGAAASISGGYTANGLSDIIGGLLAKVAEILKATTTIVIGDDGKAHLGTTTFIIKHFSGYILIST